jgi:hypothetical protein
MMLVIEQGLYTHSNPFFAVTQAVCQMSIVIPLLLLQCRSHGLGCHAVITPCHVLCLFDEYDPGARSADGLARLVEPICWIPLFGTFLGRKDADEEGMRDEMVLRCMSRVLCI